MPEIVSKAKPLQHYKWGADCDGWTLADAATLCVKLECMPPGTSEALHYHQQAQQFFYILSGTATFEIDGIFTEVTGGEGIEIKSGERHRIINKAAADLEFLLCAGPSATGDRIIV